MVELFKLVYSQFSEILWVTGFCMVMTYIFLAAKNFLNHSLLWVVGGASAMLLLMSVFPHGYTLFEINYLHHAEAVVSSLDPDYLTEKQLWLMVNIHFWVSLVGSILGVTCYLKWPAFK